MHHNKLLKYIKGESDNKEKKEIVKWLNSDPENQKKYNNLKADYVANTFPGKEWSEADYDQIIIPKIKKSNRTRIYKRIAAASILLLPVLMVSLLYNKEVTEELVAGIETIETTIGVNKTITLPDGSKVVLNSNSILQFPKHFNDSVREVTLSGEALFDVTHDEKKPFIVKTNDIDVKVLGTSFNVKSYPEDGSVETTLISGKVEVIKENSLQVVLEPSQRAVFSKNDRKINVDKVKSSEITAWKDGKLIFNETPIRQVIKELERKYEVNFEITSDSLLDYKYSGAFNDLSIDEVMKILKFSSPVNYEITNNKIILSMEE